MKKLMVVVYPSIKISLMFRLLKNNDRPKTIFRYLYAAHFNYYSFTKLLVTHQCCHR